MSHLKKKFIIYTLMGFLGIGAIYVVFIGIMCVNTGISHLEDKGFWVPILVGFLIIYITVRGFFLLMTLARTLLKEPELIEPHIKT